MKAKKIKRGVAVLIAAVLMAQPLAAAAVETGEEETTAGVTESVVESTGETTAAEESMTQENNTEGITEEETESITDGTIDSTDSVKQINGVTEDIKVGEEREETTNENEELPTETMEEEETSGEELVVDETAMESVLENKEETTEKTESIVYENAIASGTYENITWVIDADGKLTVSGTGDFRAPGDKVPWSDYAASIVLADIQATGITDMSKMFAYCSKLEEVRIAETSGVNDISYMFDNCDSLVSLDLSGFETSSVTNMEGVFWGCENLEDLNLQGLNTSHVTNMGGMFGYCRKITGLDLSGFDTSNVTDMNEMFGSCESLKELDLSNFDTGNVTGMYGMFSCCYALTELDLSGFNTEKVTFMADMFSGCRNLICLNMSGLNVSNAQLTGAEDEICFGSLLDGCTNLCIIYVPIGVRTDSAVSLPGSDSKEAWFDSAGNEIMKLPAGLSESIVISKFPVGVKYVPFEVNLNEEYENVNYKLESGTLPKGVELNSSGLITGIPLEAGTFHFTVVKADRNKEESINFVLLVRENNNKNVRDMFDPGYELIEYIPDLYLDSLSAGRSHTLVSQGEFNEFKAIYLNGRKLTQDIDYTAESGSTRITIIDETLTGEGVGTHTIGIEFRTSDNTLRRAAQNYTVTEHTNSSAGGDTDNDDNNDNDNRETGSGNNSSNDSNNDETGDNNNNNDNSGNDHTSLDSAVDYTPDFITYIIQRGDTLWRLAARYYGSGRYWQRIFQANMDILRNPNRLRIGQVITIFLDSTDSSPAQPDTETAETETTGNTYTVQSGDSLWRIASRVYGQGRLWRQIFEANRDVISDPGKIYRRQTFFIPGE